MKKMNLNPLLLIGMLLFSVTHILSHSIGLPPHVFEVLSGAASALFLLGAVKRGLPRLFEGTRFRRWKQTLIGR